MKQNQHHYGVWEVKSHRMAKCTDKEQVNVSMLVKLYVMEVDVQIHNPHILYLLTRRR